MNEEIILSMVNQYVKDGAITYDEFDDIFSDLSLREQYKVTEILYKNGINLVDEQIDEETMILDIDDFDDTSENLPDDKLKILYDDSIFQDKDESSSGFDTLVLQRNIKYTNDFLCYLIQQGDRQALQDLCMKNEHLVDKYVKAYNKRYENRLEPEDLKQVGFMGLIKAARRFDLHQGTAFSTYAVYWIKQSISREIMDNGYAIRIPVHMMERIRKVVELNNRLIVEELTFHERISQIAIKLGITDNNVRECLILKMNYLSYSSLNALIGEDEESELGEFIPDESVESVEDTVVFSMLKAQLNEVLSTLKDREQKIIRLRFGIDDGRQRTLEEIGKQFNLTRERIRQIEAKALRKLKHPKKSKQLRDYLE